MPTRKNLSTGATVVELEGSSYASGSNVDSSEINPILVGGEVSVSTDTYVTGTLQALKLDLTRNLSTVDKTYDAVTDANKVIPVWNTTDLWSTQQITGSAVTDTTTSYYVAMEENSLFSIQYTPTPVGVTGSVGLKVNFSNDDTTADITAKSYIDVTGMWGTTQFVSASYIAPPHPIRMMALRLDLITSRSVGLTSQWNIHFVKGSNS